MDGQTNSSTNNNSFTVGLDLNLSPWLTPAVLPSIPSVNTLLAAPQLGVPALANQPLPILAVDSSVLAPVSLSVRTITTADRLFTPAAVNDQTFLASVAAPASSTPKYYAAASATAVPAYSQPTHKFAIQAGGTVTFNGNSDLDGNPLDLTDDAFIYAEKGFSLNGNSVLPVQRDVAGNPLKNSAGKSLLIDQALVVASGYSQSNSNGSNNYTNLNPPQIIAKQSITIPSYTDIKQQELTDRIPVGAATVTFNAQLNTINNEAQWQQKFPPSGTATQPKIVRVINGGLNIPTNVNLSNYVIIVDNGDINFKSNSTLNNVVLVAANGSINLKQTQAENSSVLASGKINANSSLSFKGKNLLATGAGDIVLNGVTTGIDTTQNLRLVAQGQIILNGMVSARGDFSSTGTFSANGNADIYGTIGTLQNVVFNGNSTFTYANTGSRPPSIPTLKLSPSSDTGKSNSDLITSIVTPVITGTGDVGAKIKLADGNSVIGQATVGLDGYWQITTSPLINGNHRLTASASDSSGKTSPTSAPLQITIDNIAPQIQLAKTLSTVKSGTKLTGVVNGTGSAVAGLTYQWDNKPAIGITVSSEGKFEQSLDITGITAGSHNLTIVSTDIAGNSSTKTMSVQVQLPAQPPTITAQLVRDTAPNSITNGDKITFDPRIQGTVTGQVTKLLAGFDGTPTSQYVNIFAQLQPNGTYSLSLATLNQIKGGTLLDGNHTLRLIATSGGSGGSGDDHEDDDHNGHGEDGSDDEDDDEYSSTGQSVSYDFTFILDTVAPILNWVQRPDSTPLIPGSKLRGSINGTGSSAASLSYQWDSRSIVPITLNANGGFDQALDFTGISNGTHQLTLISTDLAGNTATNTFTVQAQPILDNTAPVIIAGLVVDSGMSSSDKITNTATIKGTVTDASAIAEFKAGFDSQTPANFKSVLANLQNGSFSFTKPDLEQIYGGVIPDGLHTLNLVAKDQYGNQSSVYSFNFTLDTTIPIPTLNLAVGSDTGIIGDYRTKAAIVNLTGKTEANAQVLLAGNSTPITADAQGNFTFSNLALNPKANSFTITTTDIAGNIQTYTQVIYRTSPPTAVSLSTPAVLENSISGLLVGSLTTVDPDGLDNYGYTLVDNAGGRFQLVGDKILVANGSLLDFEAAQQHQIQVRTTDSEGDSYLQTIAIDVKNVNEAPTALNISKTSVTENVVAGSTIGALSSTDPDLGDNGSFSLVAGTGDTDNSAFTIVDRQLTINQSPDFEAKNNYSLRLRVTDAGGLTFDRVINIGVTDVNEAPSKIVLTNSAIAENSSNNAVIANLTTVDPDTTDTAAYVLVNDAQGRFVIVGNQLRVANGSLLDFEANKEHQITISSTDKGGLTVTQTFTIQVTNVNEAPLNFTLSNNLAPENTLVGSVVGNFATIDPDAGDTYAYSLINGVGDGDNSAFTITSNQLRFQVSPDFETKSSYALRVKTTDAGGLSIEKQLTVNITNVNEAPTKLVLDIDRVAEGSPLGTLIGKLTSTDPDAGDTHTYTLITGNGDQDNAKFSIGGGTGTIGSNELRLNFVPDFETQSVYHLRVQTKDAGGLTWQQELTVNILDLPENLPPTGIGLSNSSIAENSANNTLIAKLNTTDPDAGNTHTYTLLNDADGRFKLVGNELQVANGSLLDFETATSHQIRVRTTDNGTPNLAYEQNLTIGVTNVNEAPLFSSQPVLFANVGQPYSYLITTIDPDTGDSRQITANRPLPSWLSLVDNGDGTAQLSGNPGVADVGLFNISLAVTDAAGIKSLQEFNLGLGTILVEGTSFNKRLEIAVTVPTTGGQLSFKLNPLQFDSSDLKGINDALEVSLVDAQGKSLVTPFQSARDAFFNWTEGESAVTGKSASYNAITGVVTLDLTGVKPGAAKLVFKLVNDDLDTTTSVRLTDLILSPTAPVTGSQAVNSDTPRSPNPLNPSFFNSAVDVSPSIGADYHRTSFNASSKELFANIALKNLGTYSISGSLVVVVNHISDPSVQVLNADGLTPEGLAYYTFKTINGKLDPSQVTPEQTLVFKNPNGVQFSYDLMVLADTNHAPVIKSRPRLEVISGKTYQYDVKAIDLDNDTLTYKLLSAPTGLTINEASGRISWNTANQDLGNYAVIVEVKDGRGGVEQQSYNLSVIETPPNRPPIFTSIPEVDAYVNTLYQYDANAIDPDEDNPLSFTLISGPDGIKVNSKTGVVNWTPQPGIILGDTVFGRIGSLGENDEFIFTGNIGQKIYLDSLKYSGDARFLGINVYSPSGILVINRASFNYGDSRLITLSENGNYKIVVDGDGSYTGNYGFSLIDPALVPIVQPNEVIKGTLSTGNEDDLYRFTGSQGQKIFIDQISNTGGTLDWVLYGPSNQVISYSNFQDMEVDLTRDGEYILALRGSAGFSQVVRYSFSVVTPELKDFELPLNQVVSGTILKKGGQDRYSFTGKAGQQIFFDSLGGKYLPFTLYDPNGRVLATHNNQTDHNPYEGFIFSMDGTYKIVIDGQGEAVGDYKFRLLDKAQAQQISLDTDIIGTFDNDGLASIGYRFALSDSRYIFLDGQAGNGAWIIYNSNGQFVTAQNMLSNSEFWLDAGDYFLVAQGYGGGNNNYKFRVITPELNVIPLIVGNTISGSIAEKGEQNTYTFEGIAGQQLFFDALGTNYARPGDYFKLKVLDPSGQQLNDYSLDDFGPNVGLTFLVNGTYRLIIDGYDETIGDYKFRLLDKAQATEISLDTDVTGTFDNGGLGSTGYRFTLNDSQYLFFDGQQGNGYLNLYNSSGQNVSSQFIQDNREFLLSAGNYFLVASGISGSGDVNYKFRIVTPDLSISPITIGNTISGELLEKGEQDTYTFEGTAGQQLFFDSLDSSLLEVRVLDSVGKQVALFDTYRDGSYYNIVIPVTGAYKLVVDGVNESIGTYKFRLLDKAVATVISLDTDIVGTFDNGGLGAVAYRLALTDRHRLFFDGQGGNGQVSFYSPNGQSLDSTKFSVELSYY